MLRLRYEELIRQSGFPIDYVIYKHFDFHNECHESSQPMVDLVDKFIFPTHMAKSNLYCKTFRLISENINGKVNTRVQK